MVLRFRLHLESLGLAAGTINQRLAAVRRLAYEAADSGLLSPELAAGIRRVKGVKQLGCRVGNWLNRDQARLLLEKSDGESLRCTRDVAMISILLGCGLRGASRILRSRSTISLDVCSPETSICAKACYRVLTVNFRIAPRVCNGTNALRRLQKPPL